MKTVRPLILFLTLSLLLASQLQAKKNDPVIVLDYVPQQNVSSTPVRPTVGMLERPIAFRLTDDRRLGDAKEIGSRTDDDDREFPLTASSDVVEFASETIADILKDRGVRVDENSGLTLACRLVRFRVLESNQAVGATYESMVSLGCALEDGDSALLNVSVTGDATRYGRKFSNANCNEVLSDAILEATGSLLDHPDIQRAWEKAGN